MTGIICYGQVNSGNWAQEWYETTSRHARKRARILRKAGYTVTVSAIGPQLIGPRAVKMTLVNIRPGSHDGTADLPYVRIENI